MNVTRQGIIWLMALLAMLFIFNGRPAVVSAMAMEQEFSGYLITAHSSREHNDPSQITKECLLMPECAASGYGVSFKQPDGKYQFFKFDENGQKFAGAILATTVKTSGIEVVVTGALEGEILRVSGITEKIRQKPVAVELTGWLIDKCCSGTQDPAKHTLECLRMKSCAATGYGILVKQPDGSFAFYKFNKRGHQLAVAYISKITKNDDIAIRVKGIWNGEILKVSSFSEKK